MKNLKQIFTSGSDQIDQGYTIESWHVSQSVAALSGEEAYEIIVSGSLVVTGSTAFDGVVEMPELKETSDAGFKVVLTDTSTGKLFYTGSFPGSGQDGTSGSSGTSGTDGTSGSSGTSGTDGTSGSSGVSGTSGTSGTTGADGDKYATTSTTSHVLGDAGSLVVGTGLAYTVGQRIKIVYDVSNFQISLVTGYDTGTGSITFAAPTSTTGS